MRKFECDPLTRTALNQHANKLDWANILEAIVTDDRIIECKKDNAANAANPWATGTTFRKLRSTGPLSKTEGKITRLGSLHTMTVKSGADPFTGSLVMRVSNAAGDRWFQDTMGPSKAAQRARGVAAGAEQEYGFEADKVFTAANGFGVKANFSISGPRFSASGVGGATPGKTDAMPHTMEIWNHTNPANPTLVGSNTLDIRLDDLVYEDPEIALENGDWAVYQCSQFVPYGDFDFSQTLLVSGNHNNEAGNAPLWESIIAYNVSRTRTTWTTSPEMDTFNSGQHVTIPNAFKAVIKNKLGAVLKTHEMHGGEAINYKRFFYGSWNDTTPMQPPHNMGMWLPARNSRPKVSSLQPKLFPGVDVRSLRPGRAKQQYTSIGVEPLINGGYGNNSANGQHSMMAHKKWPGVFGWNPRDEPQDPYMADPNGGTGRYNSWMDGWGFEPGSFSGHNWYTGPGGPRWDRAPIPSQLAIYMTKKDGRRLEGDVPWADIAHDHGLGMFNHSNHWVKDSRTLHLAANNTELLREWDIAGNYYGDSGQTGSKSIHSMGDMRGDVEARHLDKNGQLFYSGWARDGLHSYTSALWYSMLYNSAMMTVAGKFDTWWQLQRGGQLGRQEYMVRAHAWKWLHLGLAWKMATKHPLGIERELIEKIAVEQLEWVYDNVHVPVEVNNEQSLFATGLRRFGQPIMNDNGYGETQGGALGCYMSGVLCMWKQTGFWSRMMNYNPKTKQALLTVVKHYDKYVFDYTLDTSMDQWPTSYIAVDNIPANWGVVSPKVGQSDAYHNADGGVINDRYVGVHPFAAWVYFRKYYTPELPHPRLDAAFTKWEAMFTSVDQHVAAAVAAGLSPREIADRDHTYGHHGITPWQQPAAGKLGPA